MSAIAGIVNSARRNQIAQMIEKISHRGQDDGKLIEKDGIILQSSWHRIEREAVSSEPNEHIIWDGIRPPNIHTETLSHWRHPF
ncbi:hypothetical protein JW964_04395, partial [candidate division KSB1 bacterium]|nr:hypothetical protein [candidate division KSB1 bacterium]